MDRHRRFDELLGPYLLGALEPTEEREMERHLVGCHRCRSEAESLFGVHRIMDSVQGELMITTAPPGLKVRVMGDLPRWGRGNP